jgi:hypothetical protein
MLSPNLRVSPPRVITRPEINEGGGILDKVLSRLRP